MKKLILLLMMIALSGCSEKQEFENAILTKMKEDKDLKDYKLDPDTMTSCVVNKMSKNMPGLFPLDPERLKAYRMYTKMIFLTESTNPKQTLEELRSDFGSPKALADAHAIYSTSIVECMTGVNTGGEVSKPGGAQ
jgi:hypothetical protein